MCVPSGPLSMSASLDARQGCGILLRAGVGDDQVRRGRLLASPLFLLIADSLPPPHCRMFALLDLAFEPSRACHGGGYSSVRSRYSKRHYLLSMPLFDVDLGDPIPVHRPLRADAQAHYAPCLRALAQARRHRGAQHPHEGAARSLFLQSS